MEIVRSQAGAPPSHEARLLAEVVDRVAQRHPEVDRAVLASLVRDALDELHGARVRSFRAILAERAVRQRLATRGTAPSTGRAAS